MRRTRAWQADVVDVRHLEVQARFQVAQRLVGHLVRWAHLPDGPPVRVERATSDGMVEVTGYSGHFAPQLFVVVGSDG